MYSNFISGQIMRVKAQCDNTSHLLVGRDKKRFRVLKVEEGIIIM